jgi:YD repeat-containing protein
MVEMKRMKKALQMKTKNIVMAIAIFLFTISPLAAEGIEKLDILNFAASDSTAVDQSAWYLVDENQSTYWGFKEQSEKGSVEILLKNPALIYAIEMQGELGYDSLLTVEYFKDGLWVPFTMAARRTLGSSATLIDLSYNRIVSEKLRISITGEDLADIQLYEMKLFGEDPKEFFGKIPVSDITESDNTSCFYPEENLTDGNTRTSWYAYHFTGGNEDNRKVKEALRRSNERLEDILGDKDEILQMIRSIRSHLKENKERYIESEIEFAFESPAAIDRMKLFFAEDGQGDVSISLFEDGSWSEMLFIPDGHEYGWKTVELNGMAESVEKVKLSVQGHGFKIGGISEVEFWGENYYTGTHRLPVSNLTYNNESGIANGSFSLQEADERVVEVEIFNARNEQIPIEINGQQFFLTQVSRNDDSTLFACLVPSDYLWQGENFIRVLLPENDQEIYYAHVVAKREYFGKLGFNLSDGFLLTGTTIPLEFEVDLGETLDIVEVHLYQPESPGIRVFARVEENWVELLLKDSCNFRHILEGGIVTDRIRIESLSGQGPGEIQLLGSPTSDTAPEVKILWPKHGDDIGLLEERIGAVIGLVDNPDTEVEINGIEAEKSGHLFWLPLRELEFNTEGICEINTAAIDNKSRIGNHVITVYRGLPAFFTLIPEEDLIYTKTETVLFSGWASPRKYRLLVNGMEAELGWSDFEHSVPVEEGFNQVNFILIDKNKDEVVKVIRKSVVRFSDDLAIDITSPSPGTLLSTDTVIIQGVIKGAGTIEVSVNGETAIVNGSVFSSVPITLAEGVNSIEIEASDSVGNHAVKSINVEMDTIAPVISVLTPKINELIASSEVSVTGEFEDANSVTVFINEVIAHIQGNSFFGSRLFPDGNGVVSVYAIDSAGNRSADVSVPIVVDTTPPLMFDVVSSPDGWTNTMPIINFSTTDAVSGIAGYQISVAGSPFTAAESPFQVPDVDDGTHTVIVKAVDLAGWSTTSSTEIFIDTTPPDAPAEFRAVPGNDIITLKWIETDFDAVSYQITRSPIWDEDLRTVYQLEGNELEFDGETNRHFELSDFELDNGDFISYEIIAIDRAGNVSVSSVIDEAIAGYEKETYTANEGAVVEYENVTLLIGDNSLPENVLEIHITEIESEGLEELSPFPFASPIYQFTVLIETDEGEEHQGHAEFERDFIGVLEYDEEDLIEGWPEQRLGVFYFDRTWSRWIRIEKSAVDVENNKILFSTNHFSEFSVQPTIVEDLSAAELADVEFAPNKTQINHEEVSVSPQGGTVTSSFTELVLPGKNGFDFILKRTYDSATARGDAFGLNINASIGTSDIIVPGADEAVQIASATEIATNILQGIGGGMIAQVENAIKAYFQNNGDYSYSMGQGWRLNLPYIRGANGGILVRLPDGSFHNINKMDVIDSQDIGVGRRIKFENHESADFTLQIVQERISIDVTNIIFKNYLIPSWQLKTATLTLKDGTQYYMDAQGRTTKIVDASGLNEINLEYNLFRLKTIKDSMGRVIHFDYVWKLGYLVPRIDRIWLEDDSPYNREINYTLGRPDKDDVLIDVPLLREAVDVEGRSWKYDYDYHFLFSGHMGMKINPALLIADCFTGGVASAIFGSIFGVDSVTVFGGLRMECVFPLYSAQGPGIGKTLVSYDVKSLDYAEIEGADYFLGICFLPTSVQATINFTKKLVADRLYLYGGDSHNLVRSTSYSYNFMYAGYDQFINYQGTVNDGRLKTIYTYDSDTKKRNRFFTWSDYLASWVNDKIFTSSAYINEIYPYNTDIERRDARTDGLIDRTYLDWDVENMRVTGERIERSGTNYRDTDYVFDNWGNIVKQSNEMRTGERTTKAVTYSYFANTNSSKSNQVPWLTQPFSTGNITEYIHNRLLGSVTVNTLPAAMGQNAPQYIHQYNRYSNSGQKLENALWMNNAWASTQYQYNPEHGSVTEILNPEGHRTTFEYDFEGTGTPWYTVTRTEHDIEGADGSVEDYISITGYEKVSGWPAWKQNPRGFITRNSYDSLGRVTKRIVEGAEGELPVITIIEYNDTAISSTVTLPLGEITVYDYDSLGRLVLIEKRNRTRDSGFQPTDGSFALIETRLKYNGYHEITEITDPNGNSTKYDYNAAGRVLSIIYPEEDGVIPERKMDFDYHSNVETIVDERGNITRDTFDMANKLIMREQELGIETIVTETYFDGLGNETVLVDGNGNVTITSFNEIGKSEHITLPESTFFENGLGKTLSPYFKYEYNQAGHRTGEIASHETGEIRTEYAIDGLGRDIEIKRYLDGSEIVEKIYYDPNGNIVKSIDGNGKLTLFAYTSRDKLETATDAAGNTLEYTYDLRDNRKSMTDPRETSGKYDGDFTILYHYDDLKRVIGAELPEAVAGNGKPVIRFTYDPRGNLLRRMEPMDR